MRRVGHSIVRAGGDLSELPGRLSEGSWDMVELDVMAHEGELVVAHDPRDLTHPQPLRFADALRALSGLLPDGVGIDVDIKTTGYEIPVVDTLRELDLMGRTLISTMETASLRVVRAAAPELRLGLSIPRARRDYLAHPATRLGAYAMLAYLRRALPRQVSRVLASGVADDIMAHWGVVTPALVAATRAAGADLYVWTVDDADRVAHLERLGVTAVITNDWTVFRRPGPATA